MFLAYLFCCPAFSALFGLNHYWCEIHKYETKILKNIENFVLCKRLVNIFWRFLWYMVQLRLAVGWQKAWDWLRENFEQNCFTIWTWNPGLGRIWFFLSDAGLIRPFLAGCLISGWIHPGFSSGYPVGSICHCRISGQTL